MPMGSFRWKLENNEINQNEICTHLMDSGASEREVSIGMIQDSDF